MREKQISSIMQVFVRHMCLFSSRYLYLAVLLLDMEERRHIHPSHSGFCKPGPAIGQNSDLTTHLKRAERRKLPAKAKVYLQNNLVSIL